MSNSARPMHFRRLLRRLFSPLIRGPRRFAQNERGAVAVEFAILALPFFTLIFAILETSIVFLAGQMLDSAVQDASRQVRTGQAQIADWDAADFQDAICDGLYGMFDCGAGSTRMRVNVSIVSTFSSASVADPINPDCEPGGDEDDCSWTLAQSYDDGSGSSIVLVQAFYKWPTILNLPGFNLETQAGGNRLLSAVRVFRNEPF
jgi:Flp pilus assembly protein TadG